MRKSFVWAAAIVGLIGLVFLPIGIGFWVNNSSFERDAEKTTGTVIDHVTKTSYDRDGDRSVTYAPKVRFTAADGQDYEFTDSISSSNKKDIGSRVDVLYKPDDPSDARIDSVARRWLFPGIFGGVGALMVLIGVGLLIAGLRQPDLPDYVAKPGSTEPPGPAAPPTNPGNTFPGT
jgi:Protein of unknown function (DUF3592)